jgi:hypothetical protein
LSRLGHAPLANLVSDWLGNKRTRRISLSLYGDDLGPSILDRRFKVNVPHQFLPANT